MEELKSFPNIRNLSLEIMAKGHSCGASLYHVLRMCTGVTELYLEFIGSPEDCLKEVKVSNLRGTENKAGLVKRLFDWATVLETMTVTLDCSVAESKAREFCQMLQSFSRPEIRLKGAHFA